MTIRGALIRAGLVLGAGIGLLSLLSLSAPGTSELWPGYRVYFLPETSSSSHLETSLSDLPGVLSPWTARVEISDFSRLEYVPVAQLAQRLAPSDPRWTPYLHQVEALFQSHQGGRPGWLLYVPEAVTDDQLRQGVTPLVPEPLSQGSRSAAGPLWLVSYLLWVAIGAFVFPRRRPLFWALSVGGGIAVLLSASLYLPVIYLQFLLWTGLKRLKDAFHAPVPPRKEEFTQSLLIAGVFTLGLWILGLVSGGAGAFWVGALGAPLIAAGSFYLAYLRHSRALAQREHPLFSPVSLTLPGTPRRTFRYWAPVVQGLLLGLTVGLQSGYGPGGAFHPGDPLNLDSLSVIQDLSLQEEERRIPGPGLWAAHRAWQDTFLFEGGGLNQTFSIPEFSRSNGRVVKTLVTQVKTDLPWLQKTVQTLDQNHPLQLLIHQGRLVQLLPPEVGALRTGPVWGPVAVLALLFFFLVLIRWGPQFFRNPLPETIERRRDSVA